jgi:hypothetical protein
MFKHAVIHGVCIMSSVGLYLISLFYHYCFKHDLAAECRMFFIVDVQE